MNKGKFFMLVGIPGSGKSTKAKEYAKKFDAIIISSDEYRKNFWGDEAKQYDKDFALSRLDNPTKSEMIKVCNDFIFEEMQLDTVANLREGKNIIYDATNLYADGREKLLSTLNSFYERAYCVLISCTLQEALKRNKMRKRQVPDEVIKRMHKKLQIPSYDEGWDIIKSVVS